MVLRMSLRTALKAGSPWWMEGSNFKALFLHPSATLSDRKRRHMSSFWRQLIDFWLYFLCWPHSIDLHSMSAELELFRHSTSPSIAESQRICQGHSEHHCFLHRVLHVVCFRLMPHQKSSCGSPLLAVESCIKWIFSDNIGQLTGCRCSWCQCDVRCFLVVNGLNEPS